MSLFPLQNLQILHTSDEHQIWTSDASYLCFPHAQCTSWQTPAPTCPPAGTGRWDCSQTPGLWNTNHKHPCLKRHLLVGSSQKVSLASRDQTPTAAGDLTFNVAFISNGLVGGPARQELLELHPGLLLVWQVHAHRTLDWWGPEVWPVSVQYVCLTTSRTVEMFCPPPFFRESLWSFSLSCFSLPGDSSASSSIASSDSQAWRNQS